MNRLVMPVTESKSSGERGRAPGLLSRLTGIVLRPVSARRRTTCAPGPLHSGPWIDQNGILRDPQGRFLAHTGANAIRALGDGHLNDETARQALRHVRAIRATQRDEQAAAERLDDLSRTWAAMQKARDERLALDAEQDADLFAASLVVHAQAARDCGLSESADRFEQAAAHVTDAAQTAHTLAVDRLDDDLLAEGAANIARARDELEAAWTASCAARQEAETLVADLPVSHPLRSALGRELRGERPATEATEAAEEFGPDGYNRLGWDRDGYSRDGYDRDGLSRDGWYRTGFHVATDTRYGPEGRNVRGEMPEQERQWPLHERYATSYNAAGFNSLGEHRSGTRYGPDGYDMWGHDRSGVTREGWRVRVEPGGWGFVDRAGMPVPIDYGSEDARRVAQRADRQPDREAWLRCVADGTSAESDDAMDVIRAEARVKTRVQSWALQRGLCLGLCGATRDACICED